MGSVLRWFFGHGSGRSRRREPQGRRGAVAQTPTGPLTREEARESRGAPVTSVEEDLPDWRDAPLRPETPVQSATTGTPPVIPTDDLPPAATTPAGQVPRPVPVPAESSPEPVSAVTTGGDRRQEGQRRPEGPPQPSQGRSPTGVNQEQTQRRPGPPPQGRFLQTAQNQQGREAQQKRRGGCNSVLTGAWVRVRKMLVHLAIWVLLFLAFVLAGVYWGVLMAPIIGPGPKVIVVTATPNSVQWSTATPTATAQPTQTPYPTATPTQEWLTATPTRVPPTLTMTPDVTAQEVPTGCNFVEPQQLVIPTAIYDSGVFKVTLGVEGCFMVVVADREAKTLYKGVQKIDFKNSVTAILLPGTWSHLQAFEWMESLSTK